MNSRERFLCACRRDPVDRPPVWLMRQAGRYLPEYRELREKYDFMTLCRRPGLIFEASLQPWRRYGMDAVIVFSDILLPLQAMGPRLTFEKDQGPQFEFTIRTIGEIKRLSNFNSRISFEFLLEAMENLRHEIKDDAALLGFIGAPWTLAVYLMEGGSTDFQTALRILNDNPETVDALMKKISGNIASFAVEQARAGADAIQIFDTWGGLLTPSRYLELVLPHLQMIVDEIHDAGAPVILFVKKSAPLLDEMIASGADVISVSHDISLADAFERLNNRAALQGNMDPEVLLRSPTMVGRETQRLLDAAKNRNGFIANLGHGVLPETPVESVKAFVETVKNINDK